ELLRKRPLWSSRKPPQPLHELTTVHLLCRLRGRDLAEAAVAGEQVVLAALFHDLDPTDCPGPREDPSVASRWPCLEPVETDQEDRQYVHLQRESDSE